MTTEEIQLRHLIDTGAVPLRKARWYWLFLREELYYFVKRNGAVLIGETPSITAATNITIFNNH